MSNATKTAAIQHAEERAAYWLMVYNELEERGRGQSKRAQDAYAKSARWLMRANEIAERA